MIFPFLQNPLKTVLYSNDSLSLQKYLLLFWLLCVLMHFNCFVYSAFWNQLSSQQARRAEMRKRWFVCNLLCLYNQISSISLLELILHGSCNMTYLSHFFFCCDSVKSRPIRSNTFNMLLWFLYLVAAL